MIIRVWHGWTTPEGADAYQKVLSEQVLPMIEGYTMPGFRGIKMMRRDRVDENGVADVEFATLMEFDDLDSVKAFVGDDIETAHVPDIAQAVLKRWDTRVVHYEGAAAVRNGVSA